MGLVLTRCRPPSSGDPPGSTRHASATRESPPRIRLGTPNKPSPCSPECTATRRPTPCTPRGRCRLAAGQHRREPDHRARSRRRCSKTQMTLDRLRRGPSIQAHAVGTALRIVCALVEPNYPLGSNSTLRLPPPLSVLVAPLRRSPQMGGRRRRQTRTSSSPRLGPPCSPSYAATRPHVRSRGTRDRTAPRPSHRRPSWAEPCSGAAVNRRFFV